MFSTDHDLSDDGIRQKITSMFPAFMNQEDESNNQKMLNVIADIAIDYKNSLLMTYDQMHYLTATGKNLADIASDYGVNRIDDDDNFLRFEIAFQILKKRMNVTQLGTKQVVSFLFGIPSDKFKIVSGSNPESIKMVGIPADLITGEHADVKKNILENSIQSMLPPEFELQDIEYIDTTQESIVVHTANQETLLGN